MKLFALLLVAAAACAQTSRPPKVEATFHFSETPAVWALQESITIARTVADVPTISSPDANTILLNGPADTVDMAQWILTQLQQPGNATRAYTEPIPQFQGRGELRIHFVNSSTPQQIQELLTILRTVADLAKVFNYSDRRALVLRGSADELPFVEWLIAQIDLPAGSKPAAAVQSWSGKNFTARVNFLSSLTTPRGMQELLTTLRQAGGISKIFNYTESHAVALRGTETDVARAEWLISQLDRPSGSGFETFRSAGADDVTRVFFLTSPSDPGIKAAVAALRAQTSLPHISALLQPGAIVVRGTADQVESAVAVMAQGNGLAMLHSPKW